MSSPGGLKRDVMGARPQPRLEPADRVDHRIHGQPGGTCDIGRIGWHVRAFEHDRAKPGVIGLERPRRGHVFRACGRDIQPRIAEDRGVEGTLRIGLADRCIGRHTGRGQQGGAEAGPANRENAHLTPGRQSLTLSAETLPGKTVMDLKAIRVSW